MSVSTQDRTGVPPTTFPSFIPCRPMIGVYQFVWLASLLVATSDGQRLKLANASNLLASINNRLGNQSPHVLDDLVVKPDNWSSSCPCCDSQCSLNRESSLLTCLNVLSFKNYPKNCSRHIEQLEIYNAQFKSTSLSDLPPLPSLQRLSIIGSIHLDRVDYLPQSLHLLTHLTITNNSRLSRFDSNLWQLLKTAHNLTYLNLAYNRLNFIDGDYLAVFQNLNSLYLSGNRWDCNNDFQWVLSFHDDRILQDGDALTCKDATKRDSWIEWKYSILKRENHKKIVEAECRQRTPTCSCRFASAGKQISYTVQVDCSRRNLTILPEKLPDFTKELDVSENELNDLDQVAKYNSTHLKILIADSNHIRSIINLSSTAFMRNFNRLSLQNNRIPSSEIPWEEISTSSSKFEQKYLYLSNNSWDCDCELAIMVQGWLGKNRHIVNDSSLLFCSHNGKKTPVLTLLPVVMCLDAYDEANFEGGTDLRTLSMWNIIIGLEILLIAIATAKFAYDSWRYLHDGKLPWIAAKIM